MPGYIGAPSDSAMWERHPAGAITAGWTTGPTIAIVVGPVYFLYGGASVWTLVR